jgi:hypothetical protein
MSGAIGSIANQEWAILANQVANIDELKGVGPLMEQIELVEEQAKRAIRNTKDVYEKTRNEDFERFPQFRNLPPSDSGQDVRESPPADKNNGWSVVRK